MFATHSIAKLMAAVSMTLLLSVSVADTAAAGAHGCCAPVCCPPPVMNVTENFCLVDPCTGCSTAVTLCIPETCCGEAPCITWRSGIFGRRIATLCWTCCRYKVEVVITHSGRVIVRN